MPSISSNRLLRRRDINVANVGSHHGNSARTRTCEKTYKTENEVNKVKFNSDNVAESSKSNESRVLRDRNNSETLKMKVGVRWREDCSNHIDKKDVTCSGGFRQRPSLITMSGLPLKFQMLEVLNSNHLHQLELSEDDHKQRSFGKSPLRVGYLCHFCGTKCDNKEELRKHLTLRHSGDGFYTCTICSERLPSYFSMFSLEQHMLSHKSGKGFSCSVCRKTFRYERSLRNHIVTHSIAAGSNSSTTLDFNMPLYHGTAASSWLETDVNCNLTIPEKATVSQAMENSLLECMGLTPRPTGSIAFDKTREKCDSIIPNDVIADTVALHTPLLGSAKNRYDHRKGVQICKGCVVRLTDIVNSNSKPLKCTKCGKKFRVSHKLHHHIIESLCRAPGKSKF